MASRRTTSTNKCPSTKCKQNIKDGKDKVEEILISFKKEKMREIRQYRQFALQKQQPGVKEH